MPGGLWPCSGSPPWLWWPSPVFARLWPTTKRFRTWKKGLADLDSWTVAGKWLERSLAEDTRHIEQTWQQTFPMGRAREDLFLNLAQVAGQERRA